MTSCKWFLISLVETSSPSSLVIESENKFFNKIIQLGVSAYLLFTTLEMVEISKPEITKKKKKKIGIIFF